MFSSGPSQQVPKPPRTPVVEARTRADRLQSRLDDVSSQGTNSEPCSPISMRRGGPSAALAACPKRWTCQSENTRDDMYYTSHRQEQYGYESIVNSNTQYSIQRNIWIREPSRDLQPQTRQHSGFRPILDLFFIIYFKRPAPPLPAQPNGRISPPAVPPDRRCLPAYASRPCWPTPGPDRLGMGVSGNESVAEGSSCIEHSLLFSIQACFLSFILRGSLGG